MLQRLVLTFLLIATPAKPQELIGHIAGSLQGSETDWFVTTSEYGGQSDWSGDPDYALVNIFGHRNANTTLEIPGAVAFSFEMVAESGGYNVLGSTVTYFRQADIIYMSQTDKAEIQVEQAVFEEGELSVSGKFAATLGATEDFGQTLDMSDSRVVQGTFEATLLILE
jgi:hypothetical protein